MTQLGQRQVTLHSGAGLSSADLARHPLLRRWDHRGGAAKGEPALAGDGALQLLKGNWLTLEEGVQVQFAAGGDKQPHEYRVGDYWMIPARTATGDVEWPQAPAGAGALKAKPQPLLGVVHHFAPLAVVVLNDAGKVKVAVDLRRRIPPMSVPV